MVQEIGPGPTIEVSETNYGDNDALPFGDADDATIRYNGTNFIIDPKVVGSGDLILNGVLDLEGGIKLPTFLKKNFRLNCVGSILPDEWQLHALENTPTVGMTDGIDEGVSITSDAAANSRGNIAYNNIRNIDPASCTLYFVFKFIRAGSSTVYEAMGIASDEALDPPNASAHHWLLIGEDNDANFFFAVKDGSTETKNDTGIAKTQTKEIWKITNDGSTATAYRLESGIWTSKATDTAALPTVACQPIAHCRDFSGSAWTAKVTIIDGLCIND